MNFSLIIILLIIALALFIVGKIMSKFKVPKVGSFALVTGGVKSGKDTFAVNLAWKTYKRVHRSWKIRSYFQRAFGLKVDEEPLLYSSIPLAVPYVPITHDLLMRKTRFRYKSVIYISEASLVADSQLCQNMTINELLMLFNKLIGHETKGGLIIYNTQSVSDLHYSIKRCVSEVFYIHHLEKRFPFIMCAKVREERYSEDGLSLNAYTDDVEASLKKVLISKKVWKKFDAYCFSSFTDDLPVEDTVVCPDKENLKVREILSFRPWKTIKTKLDEGGVKNVKSDNGASGRKASNDTGSTESGKVSDETSKAV